MQQTFRLRSKYTKINKLLNNFKKDLKYIGMQPGKSEYQGIVKLKKLRKNNIKNKIKKLPNKKKLKQ